jgi:hypothetical protein
MRLFCHISEFQGGMDTPSTASPYSLVPIMLLASETTTLWAPSPWQIESGHDRLSLTWQEFLVLIRDARNKDGRPRLRVIARKPWLVDPNCESRKKAPHGTWHPEFDGGLLRLFEDDLKHYDTDPGKCRVCRAEDEEGWTWAGQQVRDKTVAYFEAQERYRKKTLPPGFLRKADNRGGSEDDRIEVVLRDARNHQDAIGLADADFPVEPSIHADAIQAIYPCELPTSARPPHRRITAERIMNALEIAASLSRPRNVDEWLRFLEREEVEQVREELSALMRSPHPGQDLLEELEGRSQPPSLLDAVVPRDGREALKRYGGLPWAIISLLQAAHDPLALIVAVGSGLWTAWESSEGLREKLSISPTPGYPGKELPVLLGHDRTDPTYREAEALAEILRQGLAARKFR